jgi:hypothetical protein
MGPSLERKNLILRMLKTSLFNSNLVFEKEFERCCKQYSQIDMYVAWVGNPNLVIPFEHLHSVSKINAVVGISFCQTNPDGLQFLLDLETNLRIADIRKGKKEILFHPKIYIFSKQKKKAVFIGSSNFTMNGFNENCEANVLIEGASTDKAISNFQNELKKWRTQEYSFVPDENWLKKYAERYYKRRKKLKAARLEDEAENEERTTSSATWLAMTDWDLYLKKVMKGLKNHSAKYHESLAKKIELFKLYEDKLSVPWKPNYFSDINKRRLIGGIHPYGWLGHVAASGDFRRMLANGTNEEYQTILSSINAIARLSLPLNWKRLRSILDKLIALGPSMKVWGRLLAIVRPDLFCTISAPRVRKNIANTLELPERVLKEVDGYLMLLQLIHSSPWFKSEAPAKKSELEIWKRRVAFLDVVFYN